MVEIYNKLILNKYTFLRFEVNNMNLWTKVYLVSNSDEIYLGADSYDILYKKICDGFFSENHNYKSFNFEDEQYICPLVLQEPYVCICRTKNKNNFKVLFLGDYYKIIRAKIIVNSKLLRFE